MPPLVDRTGQRYGRWTVLRRSEHRQTGRAAFWDCRCDCGTEAAVVGGNLASGISTNCGCDRSRTTVELAIGAQFGAWTVLYKGPPGRSGGQTMWGCRCACGTERLVRSGALRHRQSLSCGCARTYEHNTIPAGDPQEYVWRFNAYADKAKRRGHAFDLSLEQFIRISGRDCHYCGASPAMPVRTGRKRSTPSLMNGIDRVDNSVGYVLDNCVPCCTWCNEMKRHRPQDAFLAHVRRIAEHNAK
ncbi:HNH endonuclease [Xanthomonas virus phiXaf18]|uniref:HNH endonuclease n=1 Tax=Xanthomonas virus phiXaf18 TaxID=2653651 RepID=A0A5P8PQI1_9CAUD|nr:HNH endonuclease [Xanthomonas virus phiXaf18]QFR59542.1 hypothetical protein phiXaf18_5 [Xanthomonas virus phiXaf18]